jgi:glycerol-3-phosphate acyltransferase PlsX
LISIAFDLLGGDKAPEETVRGLVLAMEARSDFVTYAVATKEIFEKYNKILSPFVTSGRIEEVCCESVFEMDDEPVRAWMNKKGSSLHKLVDLVNDGLACGCISLGSTGGCLVAGTLGVGRLKGIERPAIGVLLPSKQGGFLLIDAGANVDVKPKNILDFARMGSTYMKFLGFENPSVGLFNVGEEKGKGDRLRQESYELLSKSDLNFTGNMEGKDAFFGKFSVLVCDGFIGNIFLKTTEGVSDYVRYEMRDAIRQSFMTRLGGMLLYPALARLIKRVDYSNYGAAPLLGVKKVFLIGHGRSGRVAAKNAILQTVKLCSTNLIEKVKIIGES